MSNNRQTQQYQSDPNLPIGIRNRGATCWINSTLQVLASVPGVVEYFLGSIQKMRLPTQEERVLNLLQTEVVKLTQINLFVRPDLNENLFIEVYRMIGAEYNTQQDAGELLGQLFERINRHMPELYAKVKICSRDSCPSLRTSAWATNHTLTYYVKPQVVKFDLNQELLKIVHLQRESQNCACGQEFHHICGSLPDVLIVTVLRYNDDFTVRCDLEFTFELMVQVCGQNYELLGTINYDGTDSINMNGGGNSHSSIGNAKLAKKVKSKIISLPKKQSQTMPEKTPIASDDSSEGTVATTVVTKYLQNTNRNSNGTAQKRWSGNSGHWYSYGKRGPQWYLFNDLIVQKIKILPTNNAVILVFQKT